MNALRKCMVAMCFISALTGLHGTALAGGQVPPFIELDREAMRQLADPATHTRPTMLTLWSMDCVFCRKKLAELAALKRTTPKLEILTLLVEDALPEHTETLDALNVPGVRYAYGTDSPDALAFALDPDWRGELPRTVFFDGRGGRTALSGLVEDMRVLELVGLRQLDDKGKQ